MSTRPGPIPLNDLSRSWVARDPQIHAAVRRVIESGRYVQGPEHGAFEVELAHFVGVTHAVGVASGTDAIAIALVAVGCGRGSEVVVAANAGGYASVAAGLIGASVVYADVDVSTGLLTEATLEPVLTGMTDALVVTHLYGNVVDMSGIVRLARERGIPVVEDAAQAAGASRAGQHVGSFGDAAAMSFYPTKNLGAVGDGGAVVTSRDDVAAAARLSRQYGWSDSYRIEVSAGRNSRLDEIQAAILRIGLPRVDASNARRRQIVARYAEALADSDSSMITRTSSGDAAHLAVVRTPRRDAVRKVLAEAAIHTAVHYPIPDHEQPGLAPPARRTDLPVTERLSREVLTLPLFPALTDGEVERVAETLWAAVRR